MHASFICNRFGCGARVSNGSSRIVHHAKVHRHVNNVDKINCIYGRCSAKVLIEDLGQHVEAHLGYDGARCGVCRDWFASTDLAGKHLTSPCPMLVSQGSGKGQKKTRRTKA